MRADLTFMALADESNRYQFAKSVAKVTRMLHPCAGYDERGLQMARLLQTRSSRGQHFTEGLFS
jgi:hypothetical protein